MQFVLDVETELRELALGRFARQTSQIYWNFDSAFGGWVCAVAAEAVQQDDSFQGHIVSLSATFAGAIRQGELEVRPRLLRRGRTADFWHVEIFQGGSSDQPDVLCDIVASKARSGYALFEGTAPNVRVASDLPVPRPIPGPRWLEYYEQRPVSGTPFGRNDKPDNRVWIRDADGRPADAKGIIAMCDTLVPRPFFFTERPVPIATVKLQVFFNPAAPTASQKIGEFVLLEGTGDFIANHAYNQSVRVWSRDGRLLATSSQIGLY